MHIDIDVDIDEKCRQRQKHEKLLTMNKWGFLIVIVVI